MALGLVALFSIFLWSGCSPKKFSVSFSLPAEIWGNYRITYYASDGKGGAWINLTAPLEQGKFRFEGISRQPALIYISNGGADHICIYAKPGDDIKISGEAASPRSWQITGNKICETMTQYLEESYKNRLQTDNADAIAKFVEGHRNSPASAILLLTDFPRNQFPERFVELWNSLEKDADKAEIMRLSGSADFSDSGFKLTVGGDVRMRNRSMTIRSLAYHRPDGATDTLHAAGKRSLIYAYDRTDDSHREIADTIRHLIKEFPDSSKRNILMLDFYPDSVVWISHIERDSLKSVQRGWVPLAQADARMQRLGIGAVPEFIVVGRKGEVRYRGNDIKKAAEFFRQ